nr:LysR family transcriptional regulator [Clostridia bacterium]
MDLQKLRYFYTAARLEHITHAAEEIHIAQPSLTKALHLLEEELGVPLFKKNGRSIELTEFGIYLKQRLDSILPELDRLPYELAQLKERSDKTVKLNIL